MREDGGEGIEADVAPRMIAPTAASADDSAAAAAQPETLGVEASPQAREAFSHLRLALALLERGDAAAAVRAASDACRRAPDMPEAHYVFGQAFAALGEPARAAQAFARAIQLKRSWADAWVNLGVMLYKQGRIEDAKTAMRRALGDDPRNAMAASNLAAFLRITGQAAESERLLQTLVAHYPDNIGARLNLAADLLLQERPREALDLLQAVAPPQAPPAAHAWRLSHAVALIQLSRLEEARASLAAMGPVPPALAPLLRWRYVILACAEGDFVRARAEAQAMEAALAHMGPDATPEHAIMARYDLAKFWSSQNAPLRAMAQWSEGHTLLAKFQPFSRDDHRALVDASIEAFSRARLHEGARARNCDPAPVFIVGMPRSGTTLVEQILAAHRDVFGAGERTALNAAFHALGGGGAAAVRKIAALETPALEAFANKYLAEMRALAPDKHRIVDKMPGNFLYLGLIALLFPSAKIIHCRRDPRDIGLSIFTYRFHGAHGYAHDLGDLGWYIGEHDRLMAHWKTALPNPILEVKLSDWVDDFDATLARVLGHLDLPPDPACARFYESDSRVRTVSRSQVRQPINAKGLGRWRAYEAPLAPLIEALRQAGSLSGWE